MQLKSLAVDTSKAVFTVHGVDAQDRPILRQNLGRAQFEVFCRKLAATEVVRTRLCGVPTRLCRRVGGMRPGTHYNRQ